MYDAVFFWLIVGLFGGLLITLACALPALWNDYKARQKSYGRNTRQ